MSTQITIQKILSFDNYADLSASTGIEGYIYIDKAEAEAYLWDSVAGEFVRIGADTPIPPDPPISTFVDAATTGILSFVPNYYNGPLSDGVGATLTATQVGMLRDTSGTGKIDSSYVPVVGGIILVKNQVDQKQNGIYSITTVGSPNPGGTLYQLTRVADFDQSAELFPLQVNVLQGTVNANQYFNQATPSPLVIGTSNLVFSPANYATAAGPIAFVDVATTTALPTCVYANGTTNPSYPGLNATLTASAFGTVLTVDGLTASTSATPLGTFTRVLVKNQANKAHNGDYVVVNGGVAGSSTVKWQLRRINYAASGFYRFTRYFLVSNTQASLAGKIYITKQQDPALTNLGIGTQLIDLVEYGGASTGPFGIANSSGVYTYYATMTLAMAAAGAGTNKTVEMFADVTEAPTGTIQFPTGVTLNGNGHTYTFNSAGALDAFILPQDSVCYIFNTTLKITQLSSGSLIVGGINSILRGDAVLSGNSTTSTSFPNSQQYILRSVADNRPITVSGFTIVAEGTKSGVRIGDDSFADNLTIYSDTGQAFRISGSAQARNCNIYAKNPSNDMFDTTTCAVYVVGSLTNSFIQTGGANATLALSLQGGGSTTAPKGITACEIISLTGDGVQIANAADIENCRITVYGANKKTIVSTVNPAETVYVDVHNCILRSLNGPCVEQRLKWLSFTDCYLFAGNGSAIANNGPNTGFDVIRLIRCFIEVAASNPSYHGVVLGTDNGCEITNCYFSVVNASSYAITALGAITAKYSQNTFKGSTTPINPLVTQEIINTQDNQGNILI
jgi:hypothetical protein